jgi:hypothetical protein
MKYAGQINASMKVPNWLPPTEARKQLEEAIDNFVNAAAEATAAPEAALALKVTAGLGKTSTALRIVARYGNALLAHGHVLIYLPTLDLAERAHADFQALAPRLPSRVIRGRDALRPDERKKKMCERSDIAKKISGIVPSVTQALCRAQDPNGDFVQSPCASGCPYLQQKDVSGAHVVFMSHAYLTVNPPIDRNFGTAIRIIDEKVWPTLKRTSHLSIDDFIRPAPKSYPESLHGILSVAKAAIIEGLQRDDPARAYLQRSGIDAAQLQLLAQAEKQSQKYLEIGPWQSAETLEFSVGTFDSRSFIASRQRQRIFERLCEEKAGHCGGLNLVELKTDQTSQRAIQLSGMEEVDRDAPLLFLDADADPDITERIAPGAAHISFQSPPVAEVVQISDLTLSNSWLLHAESGFERRTAILKILKREVDRAEGGGVLVVASKAVLRALHEDIGNSLKGYEDEVLKQPLLDAMPRWFGPRMQGVNDFEKYAAIVVIGRLQPGIADIETSARAVFSKDEQQIAGHASGPLPAATAHILMSKGSNQTGLMRAHPDSRAQAILAQSRECATLQAIARLRLVAPNRDKRVVILSNLPLPEFPITRRCTFNAIARDLESEADWLGFERMENALLATMGRPVRGVRLSANGLAADLPLDFSSESAAKAFRRGRTAADLLSICQRVAEIHGWSLTPILLRRNAGGKAMPAIVLDDGGSPHETARAMWPEYFQKSK